MRKKFVLCEITGGNISYVFHSCLWHTRVTTIAEN